MPRPQEHVLKCWPAGFEAITDGRKTHEFRKDDRGYRVGDLLILREWDPAQPRLGVADEPHYTGRQAICHVTYISRGPEFGIPEGYVVMSVSRVVWDRPQVGHS
jgi:hypothetical protein